MNFNSFPYITNEKIIKEKKHKILFAATSLMGIAAEKKLARHCRVHCTLNKFVLPFKLNSENQMEYKHLFTHVMYEKYV